MNITDFDKELTKLILNSVDYDEGCIDEMRKSVYHSIFVGSITKEYLLKMIQNCG
jgi:hypothetical protein